MRHDVSHVGQRFHVVHHRRHAERTDVGRERRLDAGISALALQRFDQAGFLTTDVGPGAAVQQNLQIHVGTENVAAEVTCFIRLVDGCLHALGAQEELAAQVDERQMRSHCVAAQDQPFEHLVRVVLQQQPVLERAGF